MCIKCIQCGWCCHRAPCPTAILNNWSKGKGRCEQLIKEGHQYKCKMVLSRNDSVVVKDLLIGKGCTHKYGPHPSNLLKLALENGLKVKTSKWFTIKEKIVEELKKMSLDSCEPESINRASEDFLSFCIEMEK